MRCLLLVAAVLRVEIERRLERGRFSRLVKVPWNLKATKMHHQATHRGEFYTDWRTSKYMNHGMLGSWGSAIFSLYVIVVILIGWGSRRRWPSSNDYLNASRSLPTWAATLSFLAYNCGSIEVIGMSAMAAQYGVQALHFYWIGGVPGMVFMAIVVLPVYMQTGARSLPEYLGIRFGPRARLLNACISLAATVGFAGVTLYALVEVLHLTLGWSLLAGVLASASVVLVYVLLGGVRATIFTSIFQLCVMVAGLTPLLFLTVHFTGTTFLQRSDRWRLWGPLPWFSPHASIDSIGVVLGLGFVVSFSYWCTDFVAIQRAMTARTVDAARSVPLLAGFGKMAFALLIVLPGVAAPSLLRETPMASFNETMIRLMSFAFGPTLLALGTAALIASLMAGLAGNVSGFSALWTEEVYRSYLCKGRSERQYIRAGRIALVACILLAQLAAYATVCFHDMVEFLQLIVALFCAPMFAAVLAGMFSKRVAERAAIVGILLGICTGFALQIGYWMRYFRFGSQMTANFYAAILGFSVALLGCVFSKSPEEQGREAARHGQAVRERNAYSIRFTPSLGVLSVALLVICLFLNLLWR